MSDVSIGKCKDCRFWKQVGWVRLNDDFDPVTYSTGTCTNSLILSANDFKGAPPENGLVHFDYEKNYSSIYVGPKFGCVLFKPKRILMEKEQKCVMKAKC